MPKMHHTDDKEILTNPDKLVDFVKSAVLGQPPLYWETEKVPKTKHSLKVVGEDFEKRVFDTKKDVLLLVHHPIKEKNRKMLDFYEEFSRTEKSKNKEVLYARVKGVNESSTFKFPEKLPALIYFKRPLDSNG